MAGEGSVLNMIKTLKANRSLLRKRKPMSSSKNSSTKSLKDHKVFTTDARRDYHKKLVKEKAANRKKMILAGLLTIIGLIVVISGLIYWMRMVFDF